MTHRIRIREGRTLKCGIDRRGSSEASGPRHPQESHKEKFSYVPLCVRFFFFFLQSSRYVSYVALEELKL